MKLRRKTEWKSRLWFISESEASATRPVLSGQPKINDSLDKCSAIDYYLFKLQLVFAAVYLKKTLLHGLN